MFHVKHLYRFLFVNHSIYVSRETFNTRYCSKKCETFYKKLKKKCETFCKKRNNH